MPQRDSQMNSKKKSLEYFKNTNKEGFLDEIAVEFREECQIELQRAPENSRREFQEEIPEKFQKEFRGEFIKAGIYLGGISIQEE